MTVLFDRLSYMDRLTAGGVTDVQARLHADALDLALREAVVTKPDLDEAIQALRYEFDGHFQQIDERFQGIEIRLDKLESRLDKLEGRLDKLEGRLESMEDCIGKKITAAEQRMTIRLGGMMAGAIALVSVLVSIL